MGKNGNNQREQSPKLSILSRNVKMDKQTKQICTNLNWLTLVSHYYLLSISSTIWITCSIKVIDVAFKK